MERPRNPAARVTNGWISSGCCDATGQGLPGEPLANGAKTPRKQSDERMIIAPGSAQSRPDFVNSGSWNVKALDGRRRGAWKWQKGHGE